MNEELIDFNMPTDENSIIKVIGVGGGGSNAVNHMFRQGIKDVNFVVCNTDAQALVISPVPIKIQLGSSLTEGRGAGNKPDQGRQAAIENIDEVKRVLANNTKMVFITAGMGGGTGTGAAPVIAQVAREMNILTVGIVTIPFRFEGTRRINQALLGIEELKENVDSLLVINNEKLREIYGDLKLTDAFAKADNVLTMAAKGIAEIITVHGYINVDFADVHTVMFNSGVSIMGAATASGENRAIIAIQEALTSPLLNNNDITGSRNILLNITSGTEEVTMDEIGEITDFVQNAAGSNADIIWGNGTDESLGDKISVTIIATGFGSGSIPELLARSEKNQKEVVVFGEKPNTVEFRKPTPPPITQQSFNFDPKRGDVKHESFSQYYESKGKENSRTTNEERLNTVQKSSTENKKLSEIEDTDEINRIENVPAYKRRNVDLDNRTSSDESDISRYTLKSDENDGIRLSPNNPYIHDKVD
ncbi:MAG: cell division protein FtsZ [Bacteroidetes bacterium GWF2_38_335]|nr:MAG: cell division protein FtsZ [Bacteroidetes bacterium GWF2_38_335]OFY79680.1 MAG: cell division protein FtsZ [Bacteroidetes bacterium RIFOXYA12_FULL_38_20]HBS88996.1 cell division protein FtsZ [Bacteroidales bacterium]